ncbi:hypothetical protein BOX15_Mlig031753g1, partial [Macrostomum lignano]
SCSTSSSGMACGSGSLYALDLAGRVFSISSSSSEWQPVSSGQSKLRHFKRLAPASWCLWAIGNDQQLFLMVLSSDMKIRYQESVVEHERYSPIGGFSGAKLLNNDPPHFALQVRQSAYYKPVSLRSVRPPSSRWTWEDDWHLEEAGPATDKLGWQYALDFNKAFAPEKRIAFVRKRRWLRHRYFSATDRWLLIPAPSSQFPTDDPFREVSVGGQWMPHQNDGYLALWAVTVKGQLVYRTGVDRLCPEGLSWWLVSPPSNTEQVTGVSVGPLGSVLTVTDTGGVYVRTGITWQCVTGADWMCVQPPKNLSTRERILQVSHGVRSMWAVTNTGRIWFRRGVNFSSDQSALQAGHSWVEMIGLFRQVSVSPTDQVWGIDLVSNQLLYRTGIESRKELLVGKTWERLCLPIGYPDCVRRYLRRMSEAVIAATASTSSMSAANLESSSSGAVLSLSASAAAASGSGAFAASSAADSVELGVAAEEADEKGQHEEEEAGEESAESDEARLSRQMTGFIQFVDPPPLPMMPASLAAATVVGGGVEKCAAYEAPLLLAVMDLSASALPLLGGAISTLWHPARRRGGGCSCDSQLDLSALESAVLYQLVQRDNREYKSPRFAHFGSVAKEESGLWKAEKVTHWHHETGRGCEAQLALVASAGGAKAELVLTPATRRRQQQQQTGGGKSAAQRAERRILLESVTCVAQLSNRPACLAVYTENCYHALQVTCATDRDCADWLAALRLLIRSQNSRRHLLHDAQRRRQEQQQRRQRSVSLSSQQLPSIRIGACLLVLTVRGDVLVSDDCDDSDTQIGEEVDDNIIDNSDVSVSRRHWRRVGGHFMQLCGSRSVLWALTGDGRPFVYAPESGESNEIVDRHVCCAYEYQHWRPLSGYTDRGFLHHSPPNEQAAAAAVAGNAASWSDALPKEALIGAGCEANWVWETDWAVRISAEDTDEHGWQYAKELKGPYSKTKRWNTGLRRRKWSRTYVVLDAGPWLAVPGTVALKQVSLAPDSSVAYAVAYNGQLLHRAGFDADSNPAGDRWSLIACEVPLISCSAGSGWRLYAIGADGRCYSRLGLSADQPLGCSWSIVGLPDDGAKLTQVSADGRELWAVDESGCLYRRRNVQPRDFPDGTDWELVCRGVASVNVGAGRVCAVLLEARDLALRSGMCSQESPCGTGWNRGLAGLCQSACVRGMAARR